MNPDLAYEKAGKKAEQYFNQSQQQMQPYIQQGQQAYGGINTAMQNLLNPAELQDKWASGYETSPYARMAQEMAQNQGLDAASSMGLMGSTPALKAIQAGTSQIGMADRDNYLNSLMQKYLSGAQLAQSIYGQGSRMAGQGAQNTLEHGGTMAQMAFGKQAAPGALAGDILGKILAAQAGGG